MLLLDVIRFLPINFSASCGKVVRRGIRQLFGWGDVPFGTGQA
jgi:hypothetical protein